MFSWFKVHRVFPDCFFTWKIFCLTTADPWPRIPSETASTSCAEISLLGPRVFFFLRAPHWNQGLLMVVFVLHSRSQRSSCDRLDPGYEEDKNGGVDNTVGLVASPALRYANCSLFMWRALASSCVLWLGINLSHKLLLF